MRAQRFLGIVALASAAGLFFAAAVFRPPWWTRLIVFLPLWLAGVAMLPERAKRRWPYVAAALTAVLVLWR